MTVQPPRVVTYGDSAVLVILGETVDPEVNAAVHRLASAVRAAAATGMPFGAPVPGYASLLVPVDPLLVGAAATSDALLQLAVRALEHRDDGDRARREITIATRYGGEDGPDLAEVARHAGLRPADVVELHASVAYRVYMLGFAPGFAYLGDVPAAIATPRRETPRPRVPAGSVAIADSQTAVYPFHSPGGWQLIGRTEVVLWDAARNPPALLEPGDRVRFVPSES
ncbi:MAG TPA: 5-oxoprolinase subunit PxpB [Candidatus Limnocylindrales bacterium]